MAWVIIGGLIGAGAGRGLILHHAAPRRARGGAQPA
jgi:hypothetical protein